MSVYGDDDIIIQMLGPAEPSDGLSADLEDRVSAMNAVVSGLIDEATGREWIVGAPAPATRTIYPHGGSSSVLVLPVPAVSISAITVGQQDWAGVLSGGVALDTTYWSVALRNRAGEITALRSNAGADWLGYRVVTITGVWADQIQSVPDDIIWVANFVTAERIKQEQASPAGFVGPDGTVAPIRDPWADPQVKAILRRHRVTGKGVVV